MHRQLLKPYVQKTSSRGHCVCVCVYIYIYIRLSVLGLLNRVRENIEVNRYLYIMLIHIIINLLEFDWSKRVLIQWWSLGYVTCSEIKQSRIMNSHGEESSQSVSVYCADYILALCLSQRAWISFIKKATYLCFSLYYVVS